MICCTLLKYGILKIVYLHGDWKNCDLEICALLNILDHAHSMFHSTFSIYVSMKAMSKFDELKLEKFGTICYISDVYSVMSL